MRVKIKEEKFVNKFIENFKTPTIAQIKALELFLSSTSNKISPEEKDLIKLTLSSCTNMQKMIDNYLFITKLNNEKINLNYEYFDLKKLIENTTDEISILLKYSNLSLKMELIEAEIYADKIKIKKALENLFSYIIKVGFKNTEIKVLMNDNKNGVKLEIFFSGFFENAKEYFKIFAQNQEYPIKYIELYTFKEIIKAHFGKIIFKNLDENNNVAGFYLPLK